MTLQEYMAFMISKETENVQSSEEIELAFRAITNQVYGRVIDWVVGCWVDWLIDWCIDLFMCRSGTTWRRRSCTRTWARRWRTTVSQGWSRTPIPAQDSWLQVHEKKSINQEVKQPMRQFCVLQWGEIIDCRFFCENNSTYLARLNLRVALYSVPKGSLGAHRSYWFCSYLLLFVVGIITIAMAIAWADICISRSAGLHGVYPDTVLLTCLLLLLPKENWSWSWNWSKPRKTGANLAPSFTEPSPLTLNATLLICCWNLHGSS